MKPSLRMIDPDNEHTRDIARRRVKEYVEKQEQPITNDKTTRIPLIDKSRGNEKPLDVDEVLRKSLPDHIGKKA